MIIVMSTAAPLLLVLLPVILVLDFKMAQVGDLKFVLAYARSGVCFQ
jgi:hypothetical protein